MKTTWSLCLAAVVCLAVATPTMGDAVDELFPAFRLVADDLSAVLSDGDSVVTWTDRIIGIELDENPPSYDVWPDLDQSPTYKAGVMGGHDVVRFDGDGKQWLYGGGAADVFNATGQTIVLVINKPEGEVASKLFAQSNPNDQGATWRSIGIGEMRLGTATVGAPPDDGTLWIQDGSWTNGRLNTGHIVADGNQWITMETDSATMNAYVNGSLVSTGSPAAYGSDPVFIGLGGTPHWYDVELPDPGDLDWFTGDIAEVIVFDYVLEAGERESVDAYIEATYMADPVVLGDMDGSGAVNNNDITPFVMALTDRATYDATYPDIDADIVGDIDQLGSLNNNDITPFVELLTAGQAVPEPVTLVLLGLGGLGLLRRRR